MIGEPDTGGTNIIVEDSGHPIVILDNKYNYIDTSTPIPNEHLREAVRLIERGKIDSAIVVKQDSIINLQKQRIAKKDEQILGYVRNEKTYQQLVAEYKSEISLMKQSSNISTSWVTSLQKQVRRERTKTVLVGIAGLLVSGVITYLAVK